MEDTSRRVDAPWVPCTSLYDCALQGIQRGWGDDYYVGLDCQWLDITGVPAGNYTIEVCVNPHRFFIENTFANNCAYIRVEIPVDPGPLPELVPRFWYPCSKDSDCPIQGGVCNLAQGVCV